MSGWIRMGGDLISSIHLQRHVSLTMSNVQPISATYIDVPLQAGKHIQVEPLTMATTRRDCVLSNMRLILLWFGNTSLTWKTDLDDRGD